VFSTATDINEARHKLFAKKSHIHLIHPQVQPWSNTADEQYTKADMSGSGTNIAITDRLGLDQDQWHKPFWTTLPEASKICWELISCNYKEGCVKKCKCKNTRLECAHCVLAMGGGEARPVENRILKHRSCGDRNL